MRKYEVTVAVLTYHPQKEKLFATLSSIIKQKDVSLQIVLSDDGSKEDYSFEVRCWFQKNKFKDYKFVKDSANVGTVKNLFGAVLHCDGEYIKPLSPGDLLCESTTLRRWLDDVKLNACDWSFGESVYYFRNGVGEVTVVEQIAHPQDVAVYKKHDIEACRFNYLINEDICLGAATLCKKEVIMYYLGLIVDKVFYAEDNIYRLMMFDKIPIAYYEHNVVLYEYGEGISTSGSEVWNRRLKSDWLQTNEILLERCGEDNKFDRMLSLFLHFAQKENIWVREIKCIVIPKRFSNKIKRKIYVRKTSLTCSKKYIESVYAMIN